MTPSKEKEDWKKSAREQWGLLVGPKSSQFDQEKALIKISSSLLSRVEKETENRVWREASEKVLSFESRNNSYLNADLKDISSTLLSQVKE